MARTFMKLESVTEMTENAEWTQGEFRRILCGAVLMALHEGGYLNRIQLHRALEKLREPEH